MGTLAGTAGVEFPVQKGEHDDEFDPHHAARPEEEVRRTGDAAAANQFVEQVAGRNAVPAARKQIRVSRSART